MMYLMYCAKAATATAVWWQLQPSDSTRSLRFTLSPMTTHRQAFTNSTVLSLSLSLCLSISDWLKHRSNEMIARITHYTLWDVQLVPFVAILSFSRLDNEIVSVCTFTYSFVCDARDHNSKRFGRIWMGWVWPFDPVGIAMVYLLLSLTENNLTHTHRQSLHVRHRSKALIKIYRPTRGRDDWQWESTALRRWTICRSRYHRQMAQQSIDDDH